MYDNMRVIFFYFHHQHEVQQVEKLNLILQKIASYGYYLVAKEECWQAQAQLSNWLIQLRTKTEQEHIPSEPFKPGISEQVLQQIKHFCQEKVDRCELGGFRATNSELGRGFDFRLTFYNEDLMRGALALIFDLDFFLCTDQEGYYGPWLETVEAIYDVGSFLYVYQIDLSGDHQPTLREDLLTQGVTGLYDLNIFSPELVEQLGRERLLSAPAGLITPLYNRAILLLSYVFTSILPHRCLGTSPEEVAKYLGLAYGHP